MNASFQFLSSTQARVLAIAVAGLMICGRMSASEACATIPEPTKKTLVSYVQKKYHVQETAGLDISGDTLVAGTCYRQLLFQSQGERPFSLVLYLSPDQRFLATSLLDSHSDPIAEENRRNREMQARLTEGIAASQGATGAPVTLVEFGDFQCPYCARAAEYLKNELQTPEGKSVRVVFRHFPLSFHPWARQAAEATACVNSQSPEGFWKISDLIFANQRTLTPENIRAKLLEYAGSISGLDVSAFQRCVDQGTSLELVNKDLKLGTASQVSGTPTFFLNGRKLPGIRNQEELHNAIKEALGTMAGKDAKRAAGEMAQK
jgi:protein-disulfide isomerase